MGNRRIWEALYLSYLICIFFFCCQSSAIRFLILQSRAFLVDLRCHATQHCLCWPRMLMVLLRKGLINLNSLWSIPMLMAEAAYC